MTYSTLYAFALYVTRKYIMAIGHLKKQYFGVSITSEKQILQK